MTYEDCLAIARSELDTARHLIQAEISCYPTPISGCDAQFNHLVGLRGSISDALAALDGPNFVATPRTPTPAAGIESR